MGNVNIMLNDNNMIICNHHELVKVFNEHCINVIQKLSSEKAITKRKKISFDNDIQAVDIVGNSHPSFKNKEFYYSKRKY